MDRRPRMNPRAEKSMELEESEKGWDGSVACAVGALSIGDKARDIVALLK